MGIDRRIRHWRRSWRRVSYVLGCEPLQHDIGGDDVQLAVIIIVIFDVFVVFGVWYLWGRIIKLEDAVQEQIAFDQTISEVLDERSPIDLNARLDRLDREWTEHSTRHNYVASGSTSQWVSELNARFDAIEIELSEQSARLARVLGNAK